MRSTSAAPFDNVKQFAADNRAAGLPSEALRRGQLRRASMAIPTTSRATVATAVWRA